MPTVLFWPFCRRQNTHIHIYTLTYIHIWLPFILFHSHSLSRGEIFAVCISTITTITKFEWIWGIFQDNQEIFIFLRFVQFFFKTHKKNIDDDVFCLFSFVFVSNLSWRYSRTFLVQFSWKSGKHVGIETSESCLFC